MCIATAVWRGRRLSLELLTSQVAGLYDPATGQRLALTAEGAADPALDGPQALLLTQITLR